MPSIDIQVLEGVFSTEEKAEIIRKVTNDHGRNVRSCAWST